MDVYLIRHAIAVPPGEAQWDHARPLSPKGRERFAEAVQGLDALGVVLQRVYHSPWVRARQTAELLGPLADETVEMPLLAKTPGAELLAALHGDAIALVGHQPWMGELAALLTLGSTRQGGRFPFKKGSVLHLEGESKPGQCTLVGAWAPRVLRKLAA